MADSPAFDWTCSELERKTDLDRLESRGTVRIALGFSGLAAATVRPAEMRVVLERVLPQELDRRGIEDAEAICAQIAARVELVDMGPVADSPAEVFRRLGGG